MRSCLIVDDSPTVRLAVVAAVRSAKKGIIEFHEAGDRETALRLFHEKTPDVVFLDMMLAGDDPRVANDAEAGGLTLLKKMLDQRPEQPIVVITGLPGSQPDVVEAVSLGAIAALRKPLRPEEIRYVLDALEPDRHTMSYHQ